jgi:nicotinamide-nucleotide adenylyltransferase
MSAAPDALHAVWDGRFQPFHLGHLAVIKAIREHFHVPLAVMIIHSTREEPTNAYTASVNVHHAPERNPLTWWERYHMITTVLRAERLDDVSVVGIPRPDTHWHIARHFYPTRHFICITDKDDYERSKATFWASLGEEVRVLPAAGLPHISGTMVKERIKRGGDWRSLIHPSIVDYFAAIGAPERFEKAQL